MKEVIIEIHRVEKEIGNSLRPLSCSLETTNTKIEKMEKRIHRSIGIGISL